MQFDPYPEVSDDLKAHALSVIIGRYRTTPALIQHLSLNDWICLVCVYLETQTRKLVAEFGEELPPIYHVTEADPETLASRIIGRWKGDASIRSRFDSFVDYAAAVESVLAGERPFDQALLP